MADYGHQYTEREIAKLDKAINKTYNQAYKEILAKYNEFLKQFEAKDKKYQAQLKAGEITKTQYENWKSGQVFQGEQWKNKAKSISQTLTNSNVVAREIVNQATVSVMVENANFASFGIEKLARADFGFSLYNVNAVIRLLRDNPKLLPKKKVDVPKDKAWNMKKINNAVTQSIIQGESLDKLVNRLRTITDMNKNNALTNARTIMTGAQNAGREIAYDRARSIGINVYPMWMATLDGRTRHSHRLLDGEIKKGSKYSNGCRYPGDPEGPPWEVYNCRCTEVAEDIDYPDNFERRDNIDGINIQYMTYRDWEKAKYAREYKPADKFVWNKNYTGTVNRNYGKGDLSDAIKEIQKGDHNSLEAYIDANGNLSPERIALHQQIIDNYLYGKTPVDGSGTMVMMGGGPAAGKSSVVKSGKYKLPDKNQTVTVDPDDIKQYLPGYAKMSKVDPHACEFYHEESSMIAKQLASTSFSENINVVYDGTGDGSIGSVMKKVNGAREHGYTVNAVYVTIDTDEALRRNKFRYEEAIRLGENPREVPPEYVIECHQKVTQISLKVSDQLDSIELYDNGGEEGVVKLIGIGGDGKKLTAVPGEEEVFQAFVDKGKEK